ncbi:MAG: flagellar assembly protein FliH, partial [Armatimonadetes bacterium]|nr:flagellar assembly protein FliH [Armatimonadota bacterium]
QDLEAVKEDRTSFMAMIEGLKKFDIQADPQIEQGGCIIETDLGNIDARIKTKLDALKIAFKEAEKEDA